MYIWGNMKRFFVVSAFSCVISIILTILFDLEIAYVIALGILSIISGILLYIFKKKYFINIICFGIILILISNYSSGFARKEINNVKVLYDKTAKISASIIEEPIDKQYYHVCYVKTSFIDAENTPQNVKIRLTIYGDFKADIYDELRAEVNFKKPNKYIIKSSYSDGYYLSGVVNDFEVVETSVKPLYSKAVYLRNKINSLFSKNDNYGISSAMLIGNKDAYKEQIAQMQALITEITDKSMNIQATEKRNKEALMSRMDMVKREIYQAKNTKKVATSYYKNMNGLNYVEPQFMDRKK